MKTCQSCIHEKVCRIRTYPSVYGLTGDACDHFQSESEYKQILRTLYADFIGRANKARYDSSESSKRGNTAVAFVMQRIAEDRDLAAGRVRYYCRKVGFNPADPPKENEDKS